MSSFHKLWVILGLFNVGIYWSFQDYSFQTKGRGEKGYFPPIFLPKKKKKFKWKRCTFSIFSLLHHNSLCPYFQPQIHYYCNAVIISSMERNFKSDNFILITELFLYFLFLSGFSFTSINDSQDCRGRGR